jgi:hypothetical protein
LLGGQTKARAFRLIASDRARLKSLANKFTAEDCLVLLNMVLNEGAANPINTLAIVITTNTSTSVIPS